MILADDQKEEVFSNFTGEESSFSIDATSSHIFEILRNKQYANGKESLVRELIANAKDSHAEAGKSDVPIKIWLNSSYLTIQDFGVGLSPERIRDVYLCYGKSTKRSTNGQQGFYGIGAKSFFSYASAASVTSIYDGVKREYSAYLNETNVGAFRLISEHPTDECNGVSIKIPIQSSHFTEFRNYVRKYAQFMNPPPKIIGDNVFGPTEPPKILMEGTGWKMFQEKDLSKFNVLLDGIPYIYQSYGSPAGVTFIFNTGEMTPSATRESLQESEYNTAALNKAIQVFKDEIKAQVESKLTTTDDFLEVIKTIHESKKYFPLYKTDWKWKGGDLSYPYENQNILRCHRGYAGLEKYATKVFDDSIKPGSFILVPENMDYQEVKGYVTRKINCHRTENGLNIIYLVRPSHNIPIELVTKLEDIKVNYGQAATGPKPVRQKGPKTHVYVQIKNRKNRTRYAIDNPISGNNIVIYTTDFDLLKSVKNFAQLNLHPAVEISQADAKLVKGKPHWFTLYDYIHENLTKSFTKAEIELEYKRNKANSAYNDYDYLKEHLSKEYQLAFEPEKFTDKQIKIMNFLADNGEIDTEYDLPDIHAKYPLLKAIESYYVGGIPGKHSSYYTLKVQYKDVVKYIELINKETEETKELKENENGSDTASGS